MHGAPQPRLCPPGSAAYVQVVVNVSSRLTSFRFADSCLSQDFAVLGELNVLVGLP